MPPKRKPSTKCQTVAELTNANFLSFPTVEQIFTQVTSNFSASSRNYFYETISKIKEDFNEAAKYPGNVSFSSEPLLNAIEVKISKMIPNKSISNSFSKSQNTKSLKNDFSMKKNIKKEIFDEAEEPMEVDGSEGTACPPTSICTRTPPLTSHTTDEEIEHDVIPHTALRMQQMSIKRSQFPALQAVATPRKIIAKPPSRDPLFCSTPSKTEDKMQHASQMKQKMLQKKVEQARKAEEKRKLVMERKEEIERKKREKIEEMRRKDERATEFAKTAGLNKSPTRKARVLPPAAHPKTPSSRQNFATVFSSTPGRRPAKFGRIEEALGPVATATIDLSPSRMLSRSSKREGEKKTVKTNTSSSKTVLKAKRSHKTVTANDDKIALQQAQEAYLLKQLAEEKEKKEKEQLARKELELKKFEEEEKARMEKELEERKIQEEKENQKNEEMKELMRIQAEEEEQLRKKAEKEKSEYEASIKKQAKAKQLGKLAEVTTYDMTPPRVYVAASKNDYGLDDLNSDDETDQEDDPRKEVPTWADFAVVRKNVRDQLLNPTFDLRSYFKDIPKPCLKQIFGEDVRPKKRGSSAIWRSPLAVAKPNALTFQ